MELLWNALSGAWDLIIHGNPTLMTVIWFTIQVAVISTAAAAVIGLPIGLAIGLGRFRGRRALQIVANASMGLPPVIVGLVLFLMFVPQGPVGGLQLHVAELGGVIVPPVARLV